jgi:hypothetical protein
MWKMMVKLSQLVGGDWNIWIVFLNIGNFIIPTDELAYFSEG